MEADRTVFCFSEPVKVRLIYFYKGNEFDSSFEQQNLLQMLVKYPIMLLLVYVKFDILIHIGGIREENTKDATESN